MSDVDFVRQAKTDLTYKYFSDSELDNYVINPSSLMKFRRQRMDNDELLDQLIAYTVRVDKKIGVRR